MSKIFEGLSRLQGEAPEFMQPVLADGTAADAVSNVTHSTESTVTQEPAEAPEQPSGPQDPLDIAVRTQRFRIPSPSPLLPFDGGNWHASEQYRILRTKILQRPGQPRVIVISSPGPGDGKTVTALNLAAALSLKNDSRVLLVDADFRRSSIHSMLGLPPEPGLADVLSGDIALEDALIRSEELSTLYVLRAGKARCNPAELLDTPRWRSLGTTIRQLFQYVIVDSPPLAAVTDYDLIQANCDGVLLVMRPDHSKRVLCFKALATVPKEKLIGIVLNSVPQWFAVPPVSSYYYAGRSEEKQAQPPRSGDGGES